MWEWVLPYLSTGCAVLGIRGVSLEGLMDELGVDRESIARLTPEEAGEEFGAEYPIVRCGQSGDWAWAFEPIGGDLAPPGTVAALSAHGAAFSVFASGAGGSWFVYAEGGEVATAFEASNPARRTGRSPDAFLPQMRSAGLLPQPQPGRRSTQRCLELVTAVLAFEISEEEINSPLLTGEIAPASSSWLDE